MEPNDLDEKAGRWGVKVTDLSQETQQALLGLAITNAVSAYTERGA